MTKLFAGQAPSLNKFLPADENEILTWSFLARAIDSTETVNPRRSIDSPLREGVEDVIREVMESINAMSKERGRVIDFKVWRFNIILTKFLDCNDHYCRSCYTATTDWIPVAELTTSSTSFWCTRNTEAGR